MLLHVRREHVGSLDSIGDISLREGRDKYRLPRRERACEEERRNEIGTHNGIIIVSDEKDDRPQCTFPCRGILIFAL